MMKIFLSAALFFGMYEFATPSITDVRSLYQKAATKENDCKNVIELLAPYNEENNPLLAGYKAGATMMMAKYVFNPISKLSYFNQGKKMLEKAIYADEKNIELRFLRYGLQTNIPFFLGYNNDLTTDKSFLINSIPQIKDEGLKEFIFPYLKKSGNLSETEKQKLK